MNSLQSSLCNLVLEISGKLASIAGVDHFVLIQNSSERKFSGSNLLCDVFREQELYHFDSDTHVSMHSDFDLKEGQSKQESEKVTTKNRQKRKKPKSETNLSHLEGYDDSKITSSRLQNEKTCSKPKKARLHDSDETIGLLKYEPLDMADNEEFSYADEPDDYIVNALKFEADAEFSEKYDTEIPAGTFRDQLNQKRKLFGLPPIELEDDLTPSQKAKKLRVGKRKSLTFAMKKEILRQMDSGVKGTVISQRFGLPSSTVSTIKKSRYKILNAPNQAMRKVGPKSPYEEIENLLTIWIKETFGETPIPGPIIQAKAQDIAKALNQPEFNGNNGWLTRFKSRRGVKTPTRPKRRGEAGYRSPGYRSPERILTTEMNSGHTISPEIEADQRIEGEPEKLSKHGKKTILKLKGNVDDDSSSQEYAFALDSYSDSD